MASHFFYYLSALIGLMIIWVCYREIRRLGAAAIQYLASYLALKEEGGRRQQRMESEKREALRKLAGVKGVLSGLLSAVREIESAAQLPEATIDLGAVEEQVAAALQVKTAMIAVHRPNDPAAAFLDRSRCQPGALSQIETMWREIAGRNTKNKGVASGMAYVLMEAKAFADTATVPFGFIAVPAPDAGQPPVFERLIEVARLLQGPFHLFMQHKKLEHCSAIVSALKERHRPRRTGDKLAAREALFNFINDFNEMVASQVALETIELVCCDSETVSIWPEKRLIDEKEKKRRRETIEKFACEKDAALDGPVGTGHLRAFGRAFRELNRHPSSRELVWPFLHVSDNASIFESGWIVTRRMNEWKLREADKSLFYSLLHQVDNFLFTLFRDTQDMKLRCREAARLLQVNPGQALRNFLAIQNECSLELREMFWDQALRAGAHLNDEALGAWLCRCLFHFVDEHFDDKDRASATALLAPHESDDEGRAARIGAAMAGEIKNLPELPGGQQTQREVRRIVQQIMRRKTPFVLQVTAPVYARLMTDDALDEIGVFLAEMHDFLKISSASVPIFTTFVSLVGRFEKCAGKEARKLALQLSKEVPTLKNRLTELDRTPSLRVRFDVDQLYEDLQDDTMAPHTEQLLKELTEFKTSCFDDKVERKPVRGWGSVVPAAHAFRVAMGIQKNGRWFVYIRRGTDDPKYVVMFAAPHINPNDKYTFRKLEKKMKDRLGKLGWWTK